MLEDVEINQLMGKPLRHDIQQKEMSRNKWQDENCPNSEHGYPRNERLFPSSPLLKYLATRFNSPPEGCCKHTSSQSPLK
jgi:hypothetical protein